MRIRLSAKAEADFFRIYSYISTHNPVAADEFVEAVQEKLENLSHFPFIGRERPSLARGIRSVVIANYVLFYRVANQELLVVRMIDGRMDLDEEFRR